MMFYCKQKGLKLQVIPRALLLTTATLLMAAPSTPAHASRAIETNIFMPGSAYNPTSLRSFQENLGITFHSAKWYQDWSHLIDPVVPKGLHSHGFLPELTWEPMLNGAGIPDSVITSGQYNNYLIQNARIVKGLGHQIRISFAPEMNGDWTPWAIGRHGNTGDSHKAAFRHIVQTFRNEGVTNVQWIWAPNVYTGGALTPYASFYPGDAYVDILGLDGYNWGTTRPWSAWQTFSDIYGNSYRDLLTISSRPIVITEIASTELGGDKAAWISDMFAAIRANFPRIQGFTWFNELKETDWRITSTPAARSAFINGFKGISATPMPTPASPSAPSPTPKNPPGKTKPAQIGTRDLVNTASASSGVISAPAVRAIADQTEELHAADETITSATQDYQAAPSLEDVATIELVSRSKTRRVSGVAWVTGVAACFTLALCAARWWWRRRT
jgi:hypothetical protein